METKASALDRSEQWALHPGRDAPAPRDHSQALPGDSSEGAGGWGVVPGEGTIIRAVTVLLGAASGSGRQAAKETFSFSGEARPEPCAILRGRGAWEEARSRGRACRHQGHLPFLHPGGWTSLRWSPLSMSRHQPLLGKPSSPWVHAISSLVLQSRALSLLTQALVSEVIAMGRVGVSAQPFSCRVTL